MSVWLIHAYEGDSGDRANPDGVVHIRLDEHVYAIPPNEPYEVEEAFYAEKILEVWGVHYGIIRLDVTKDRYGVRIDPDGGIQKAKIALVEAMNRSVVTYVQIQMEDRVRNGLPTLPPSGLAAFAIKKLGISLQRRYGFTPLGWDRDDGNTSDGIFSGTKQQLDAGTSSASAAVLALQAENDKLRADISAQSDTMAAILDKLNDMEAKLNKKKGAMVQEGV